MNGDERAAGEMVSARGTCLVVPLQNHEMVLVGRDFKDAQNILVPLARVAPSPVPSSVTHPTGIWAPWFHHKHRGCCVTSPSNASPSLLPEPCWLWQDSAPGWDQALPFPQG